MAATRGIAGKQGKITLNAAVLKLTAWSMPMRANDIEITNSESPVQTLNGATLIAGEYITGILDADLTFEGIFTLLENDGTTDTGLIAGTKALTPGFGLQPFSGAGGYAVTLVPNRDLASRTITGNVIITALEFGGKIREGEIYKGSGKFTGGFTATSV